MPGVDTMGVQVGSRFKVDVRGTKATQVEEKSSGTHFKYELMRQLLLDTTRCCSLDVTWTCHDRLAMALTCHDPPLAMIPPVTKHALDKTSTQHIHQPQMKFSKQPSFTEEEEELERGRISRIDDKEHDKKNLKYPSPLRRRTRRRRKRRRRGRRGREKKKLGNIYI